MTTAPSVVAPQRLGSPSPIAPRLAYHRLVNCDEHPEILPLAADIVGNALQRRASDAGVLPAEPVGGEEGGSSLEESLVALQEFGERHSRPWHGDDPATTRRRVMHFLTQYLPAVLVDGCWLHGALRVAMSHTEIGAAMTAAYTHQVEADVDYHEQRFVCDYLATYRRLAAPRQDVCARSLSDSPELFDSSFELPVLLLSMGQFPQTFLPELAGVHLAWQFLGLASFQRHLVADARLCHGLPSGPCDDWRAERGRQLAVRIAQCVLASNVGGGSAAWHRLYRGLGLFAELWANLLITTFNTAHTSAPNARQEMMELLRRKAPVAAGYHGETRLGGLRIDEWFGTERFDPAAFLDHLARSPFVVPGQPDRSPLLGELVAFGGPMLSVFTEAELATIRNWILSLPDKADGERDAESHLPTTARAQPEAAGQALSSLEFRRRSGEQYGRCAARELYYHLINREFFPEVLPAAEQFAHARLDCALSTMGAGERAIPSERYDSRLLEEWVHRKHRQQIDAYRPLTAAPRVSRKALIESTVQLAPLILIDGGWLQGIAAPALIHRRVSTLLFHVFYEEVGEGDPARHHANIYRDLLQAMGESAPPVHSREFAEWPRLRDDAFAIPVLWLSLSSFPRRFLPEILGLNLAVELAGVGGPYLEARDTLRYFGFPTRFVDVHNAADNVSAGHAAWAMQAIIAYLDDVAARESTEIVDHHWQRVWSGVRATLPAVAGPQSAASRFAARIRAFRRVRSRPAIFPTG